MSREARPNGSNSYMIQLDALRAIAVAAVVFHHFGPRVPWVDNYLNGGHVGVCLFLVLSGFLITEILLRCRDGVELGEHSGRLVARQFYIRRALRIFPVYYLALLIVAALDVDPVRQTLPWTATYSTNFYFVLRGEWHGSISHLWSLAVEEQFYLVWPWLILWAPRQHLRKLLWACIAIGPAYRLAAILLDLGPLSVWYLLPGISDVLGIGALLALYRHDARYADGETQLYRFARYVAVASVLLGAVLCVIEPSALTMVLFPAGGFLMATLLGWIVSRAATGFGGHLGVLLELRPLVVVGKVSYGIYLFHLFIGMELYEWLVGNGYSVSRNGMPLFCAVACLSLVTALVSWHFVEAPINRLKIYFPYLRPDDPAERAGSTSVVVRPAPASSLILEPSLE